MVEINIDRIGFDGDKARLILPDGYECKVEGNEVFVVKKKPRYPKIYKECCKVLMGETNFQDFELVLTKFSTNRYEENSISPEPPHISLINNFYKLIICRNAYWKIAGEEMGLGKPWDSTYGCGKWGYWFGYSINENKIHLQSSRIFVNHTLVFPTEKMRDAFYENFKDLIEQCKELL